MYLKKSLKKFRKLIVVSLIILTLFFAFDFVPSFARRPLARLNTQTFSLPSFNFTESKSYKGLPISSIKNHKAPNAWGTVIFIPQYHQYPGTNPQDPKNDSAQKAQEEIYKILDFINIKGDVNLVMTEGDLYGKVPAEKIGFLTDKLENRNILAQKCEKLEGFFKKKSFDSSLEKQLISTIDNEIEKTDREIILTGAPFKLVAEGKNVTLFGSENKETREKSTELVRDYVYLQDRKKELQTNSLGRMDSPLQNIGKSSFTNEQLLQLEEIFSLRNNDYLFTALESIASSQGDEKLANIIRDAKNSFNKLTQTQKTSSETSTKKSPSKNNNPYNYINNEETIKKMLNDDEDKIQKLIVDQRNKETAQNFAKMLKTENKNIGVLQFGAGHEEGLVKELKNQGLSVVTITSNEVLNRNLKGQ